MRNCSRTASEDFVYPQLDENEAAAMCYTSGTTGRSKGVVYSHRAMVLHSHELLRRRFVCHFGARHVLPMASLFHANGWGIPFTAAHGRRQSSCCPVHSRIAEGMLDLMEQERVTRRFGCAN